MTWSLKKKTWIFIIAFTSVTMFSIIMLTDYLYEQYYMENQIAQLSARGDVLAEVYYEQDDEEKEEFHQLISFMSRCAAAHIQYDDSENLLNGQLPLNIPLNETERQLTDEEMVNLSENNPLISTKAGHNEDYLVILNPLLDDHETLLGAVIISTPVTATFAPFQSVQGLIFAVLALAFTLIVFILKKVADYVINPVEKITAISKDVARGDFSRKIEVSNKDEIGDLAASFNYMSTSLAEADQKKQEFLGNVSHELRTPLSYLKGYSEVLLDQQGKGEPLNTKYIEKIQAEGNRMESLIHDLLDLARLEGDSYPMSLAPIPFAQLIEEAVERLDLLCRGQELEIRTDLDYSAIINGDEKRIEQVLVNLIENAVRYGKEGNYIDVLMETEGDEAVLKVIDYGEGIPADALKQLTERFYRIDKSRSRASGGTGLGLTIVKEIIKKHNGSLAFESEPGKGMTVTVKLPLFTKSF
ncbi:sensor histidine kinase [Salipaludibacillus aurantiacus]|uniref:histidine kinase n=1 Tax=Salipaludibacillus aurantiacus TaxID=1601833 RepID=A0A1H9SF15_9BACI|nr:HAMP domain-containing sensor histidine kinase [Salipaludibacillus aurantiacus]SER82799.1 Signal transduction histidine kinase [Salipaludibacillus aurantiacus]